MGKCRINNNIRTLRFHHNEMTQQELADKTGVTRQTIVAIENGKYSPTLELAFRIALVFSMSLEEVFSYTPEENPKKSNNEKNNNKY
jgi:putative transcriptional regulator